jgi:hypothetical protein
VVTDCGRDGIDGLLAGCGVGLCGGEGDEGRDFI